MNNLYQIIAEHGSIGLSSVITTDDREIFNACVEAAATTCARLTRLKTGKLPEGIALAQTKRGPKSKQVWVMSVDVTSDYGFLNPGDTFESANELSTLLGFKYDAVGIQLRGVVKREEAEKSVTLKGVTICFTGNLADAARE